MLNVERSKVNDIGQNLYRAKNITTMRTPTLSLLTVLGLIFIHLSSGKTEFVRARPGIQMVTKMV